MIAGPFSINTACFKLLRNQRIKIQVSYTPKTAGLHYEKLAVMCDNGEVRWIAVKGIGIDMHYSGLIDLQVRTSSDNVAHDSWYTYKSCYRR